MLSLKSRVAVVTGGGRGLGRLYALTLAKAGAKVVVNDYGGDLQGNAGTITAAQEVANEINALGGSAVADGGDVTKDAKSIVAKALDNFGRLDILVNNAGIIGRPFPQDDVDEEIFMRVLSISALGTVMMTSSAYPTMQKQGHGRIINVSSPSVFGTGLGNDCSYSASKGATFAITRELGIFSHRHGIKVNGILPSGYSRMADSSESLKKLTQTYFNPDKIPPFIHLLASDECPTSGEMFGVGGGRAGRETYGSFPGSVQSTAEGYLKDWSNVMGEKQEIYIPKDSTDYVQHILKQTTGKEVNFEEMLGLAK